LTAIGAHNLKEREQPAISVVAVSYVLTKEVVSLDKRLE
jgi:hypothetical protein